jgi:hypothetical protein
VRESLNKTFPNVLGGTDQSLGPLTLLGVFRPKVGSVVELHARINSAVSSVTPQMLKNTWREIEYCLNVL